MQKFISASLNIYAHADFMQRFITMQNQSAMQKRVRVA